MLSGDDLEKLLLGTMQKTHTCPHCQTENTFDEGVALAIKNGIQDKVLMCKNCQKVFEPAQNMGGLEILAALLGGSIAETMTCDKCHEQKGAVSFTWIEGDTKSSSSSRYANGQTITTTTTSYDNFRTLNEYICSGCFKKDLKAHAGSTLAGGIFAALFGLLPAFYLAPPYLYGVFGIRDANIITGIVFLIACVVGYFLVWGADELFKRSDPAQGIVGLLFGLHVLVFLYFITFASYQRSNPDANRVFLTLLIWLFLFGLYKVHEAVKAYRLAAAENPSQSAAKDFQALFQPVASNKIKTRRESEKNSKGYVCWTEKEFEANMKRMKRY